MIPDQDLMFFLGGTLGGFVGGYLLRILVVDYENEITRQRRIDQEVHGGIYTILDEFSRGWVVGDEDVERFEEEWRALLSEKSHLVDEDIKDEVGDLISFLWSQKEEFEQLKQKKEDCIENRNDHQQNVIYYPAMKKLLPEFASASSAVELHESLIDRYNRTDDENLKDAIRRFEINASGSRWSEREWEEIERRYDERITNYDLEHNPRKYHHNYMNYLFRQHEICRSVHARIDELKDEMERRRRRSNRGDAIKAVFT